MSDSVNTDERAEQPIPRRDFPKVFFNALPREEAAAAIRIEGSRELGRTLLAARSIVI